jgi:hypothetical protein
MSQAAAWLLEASIPTVTITNAAGLPIDESKFFGTRPRYGLPLEVSAERAIPGNI